MTPNTLSKTTCGMDGDTTEGTVAAACMHVCCGEVFFYSSRTPGCTCVSQVVHGGLRLSTATLMFYDARHSHAHHPSTNTSRLLANNEVRRQRVTGAVARPVECPGDPPWVRFRAKVRSTPIFKILNTDRKTIAQVIPRRALVTCDQCR